MKIEMSGYACVRADARNVKDLRTLLRFLDDNKVTDTAELDWGSGYLYVSVAEDARAEFIQCGEHIQPNLEFDVILNTHSHNDEPARYDWPAIDKYGDEDRPE
jgi:hypothetical protein